MKDLLTVLLERIPGATARDVGEVLWLLEQGVRLDETHEVRPPEPQPFPLPIRDDPGTSSEADRTAMEVSVDVAVPAEEPLQVPVRRMYARPARPQDGALPRPLDRALHRLGPRALAGARIVDVAASLRHSARLGLRLFPVLVRSRVPVGQLVVLGDQALSMSPFRTQIRDLVRAARRDRRFARVEFVDLDLSDPEIVEAPRPWRSGPEGERWMVLLVQDGHAPALRGGGLRRWLDSVPWGAVVAWIHPWDPTTWTRTPVTSLQVGAPPPRGRAVPLLPWTGPGLEALIPWAHGRGPGQLRGMMLPIHGGDTGFEPSLDDLVASFHYHAHPLSRAVVGLAAGVPGRVDLDLLRVLGAKLTDGRVMATHLAEAMTSGLFRRCGEGDSTVVAFVSARARKEGLRWLPYSDLRRILECVILHVEQAKGADPTLLLPPLPLLVVLRDGEAPPAGLELEKGVPGELRAWVNATGFQVHDGVRSLLSRRSGTGPTKGPVTEATTSGLSPLLNRPAFEALVRDALARVTLTVDEADSAVEIVEVTELALNVGEFEFAAYTDVELYGTAVLRGRFRLSREKIRAMGLSGAESASFAIHWNALAWVVRDLKTELAFKIDTICVAPTRFRYDEFGILSAERVTPETLLQQWLDGDIVAGCEWINRMTPADVDYGLLERAIDRHKNVIKQPAQKQLWEGAQKQLWVQCFPNVPIEVCQHLQREDRLRQALVVGLDSDAAILHRWVAGNRSAGDRLLKKYYIGVRRFVGGRIDNDRVVDDLVQETFQELLRRPGDIENFRPFLYGVARSRVMSWLHSMQAVDADARSLEFEFAMPDVPAGNPDNTARLLRILRTLTLDQQMVVMLYSWESMPVDEISEAFGWTVATVRANLSRATARLREFRQRMNPEIEGVLSNNQLDWKESVKEILNSIQGPRKRASR